MFVGGLLVGKVHPFCKLVTVVLILRLRSYGVLRKLLQIGKIRRIILVKRQCGIFSQQLIRHDRINRIVYVCRFVGVALFNPT